MNHIITEQIFGLNYVSISIITDKYNVMYEASSVSYRLKLQKQSKRLTQDSSVIHTRTVGKVP